MAMSAGTMSSRILGMLRDVVLQSFFSRTVTDAFAVAFGFPNKFRRLLGEGSLSVSFIPVYLEMRQKSPEEARQLANGLFSLLLGVSGGLCVLGTIFMEPLMGALVSGDEYRSVPGKFENTVQLGRIMFSYLFLVTTYAYFMSVLNAIKQFFIPAVAPAIFNLTFIIFALFPQTWGRFPGEYLAWGVIAGGVLQILVVLVPLKRQGLLPRLQWRKNVPGLGLVIRNMIPGVLGMGVLQFLTLVNLNYASRLAEGSHTYIYLADRILELPQSLIAISLGAVLLPTLSELWSSGKKTNMIFVGQRHMQTMLFLSLPSAVGMFLLAQPIVEVLYMRGRFEMNDAINTAMVVRFYAFLLVASGLSKILIPNFYAIKNTWLPAICSIISVLSHIFIAYFLLQKYGLMGLVASMTLAGFINLFLIVFFYHRMIGPFQLKTIFTFLVKILIPLSGLGGVVYFFHPLVFAGVQGLPLAWARGVALFVTIVVAAIIYFWLASVVKIQEGEAVLNKFHRRK